MTSDEVERLFEKHSKKFGNFKPIRKKLSPRPDIHALKILDRQFQNSGPMILNAEPDGTLTLDVEISDTGNNLTEGMIIQLVRCGVFLSCGFLCLDNSRE